MPPKIDTPMKDYPITVQSGKLQGSVCITGELPETMSAAQSQQLEDAIRIVRENGRGHKVVISFTISQPKNGVWNV